MRCAVTYRRHLWAAPVTLIILYWFALMALLHRRWLPEWTFWLNPLGWAFAFFDVVYNLTVGSFLFKELPREFLFTTRVQRHHDAGCQHAALIASIMNDIDPNHIKTR